MENPSKVKVLFVSAEVAPFAKIGGLADVGGALPPALKKLGVDIRILLPLYGYLKKIFDNKKLIALDVNGKKYPLTGIGRNIKIEFDGNIENLNIYIAKLFNVPVYFIENKKFFDGEKIYEPAKKFLFLSKAIIELISQAPALRKNNLNFYPDIIHCNDNHTSFIPTLLKLKNIPIRTILTIHNLEFQGTFSPLELQTLSISSPTLETTSDHDCETEDYLKTLRVINDDIKDGDVNKMFQGILLADAVTTVSPTYAKEMLTPEFGDGLDSILALRKGDLYGILNGIDMEQLNPETDPYVLHHYSTKNLIGKKKNKEELIKNFFSGDQSSLIRKREVDSFPLVGLISRLTPQKGIDLIIEAIPEMFKKYPRLLFVILGTGIAEYETKLKELSQQYPDNLRCLIKFDLKTAQEIYAGADIFLMPSKFEPCGLGQLTAMRYGTVPVVRKTGGLADTVISLDEKGMKMTAANGFMFEEYNKETMLKTIDQVMEAFKDKKTWKKLILNGMKRDSSWNQSAKEYLKIYSSILKKKQLK